MHKIVITLILLSLSLSAHAQWKEIADFKYYNSDPSQQDSIEELVTCVYFLDLPYPPTIGFVVTESDFYTPPNGGMTWHSVWDSDWSFSDYYVNDICFKDSLIGWFTVTYGAEGFYCYRTTDGGETWNGLNIPDTDMGNTAISLYYCDSTNRLFVSAGSYTWVSTDLGDTWPDTLSVFAYYYSFWTPLHGIIQAYPDTNEINMETLDGGVTWDTVGLPNTGPEAGEGEILAVPGTSTCYVDGGVSPGTIFRSDDFGHTWRIVGQLLDSLPYYTGIIKGDFSRLSIQSDSGMYVSVDSGVTWNFDGGPTYITNFSNDEFYSANGVTIAGETYSDGVDEGGGLWKEDWPQVGVANATVTNSGNNIITFPNPASNELQILAGQSGTLHLFDLMGRERMNAVTNRASVTLDISGLDAGTYFLRLCNQSTKVEIAR